MREYDSCHGMEKLDVPFSLSRFLSIIFIGVLILFSLIIFSSFASATAYQIAAKSLTITNDDDNSLGYNGASVMMEIGMRMYLLAPITTDKISIRWGTQYNDPLTANCSFRTEDTTTHLPTNTMVDPNAQTQITLTNIASAWANHSLNSVVTLVGNFTLVCVPTSAAGGDRLVRWRSTNSLDNSAYTNGTSVYRIGGGAWQTAPARTYDLSFILYKIVQSDITKPAFSNQVKNMTSPIPYSKHVRMNITITDTGGASHYKFFWNATGTYRNSSAFTYTSGVSVSTTKKLNSTLANKNKICWGYWANDSSKNVNVSQLNCFNITNTLAPMLSNARCTSCDSLNFTLDSTPTINVTCIDSNGCNNVRISNSSNFNFATLGNNRNCSRAVNSVFVCTLPSTDQFTTNKVYSVYFWANDSIGNYHLTYNLSMSINYEEECIYSGTGNWNVYSNCKYSGLNYNLNKNLTIKTNGLMNCTASHCNLNFTQSNQFLIFEYVSDLIKLIGNWTINQPN